jgi:6-phosphogluconolactonase
MEQPNSFRLNMKVEVLENDAAVADRAASIIAEAAREDAAARGRFALAVSGGRTPWAMLGALAAKQVPWASVQLFQVDERVAPPGDPDRNLRHLNESFLARAPLRDEQVHAMPVEESDLNVAAESYSSTLRAICGTPSALDLVHLGLGPDGHTASLVPGDPVLEVADRLVGVTGVYQAHRRMTLTYPALDGARRLLWVVTGEDKSQALSRLCSADRSIPAGRVRQEDAVVLADRAAAALLGPEARR